MVSDRTIIRLWHIVAVMTIIAGIINPDHSYLVIVGITAALGFWVGNALSD